MTPDKLSGSFGFELPARTMLYNDVQKIYEQQLVKFQQGFRQRHGLLLPQKDFIFFDEKRQPLLLPNFGSDEFELRFIDHQTSQADQEDQEDPFVISDAYFYIAGNFFADKSPFAKEDDRLDNESCIIIPHENESPPIIIETDRIILESAEEWARVPKYPLSDTECTNLREFLVAQTPSANDDSYYIQG